MKKHVTLIALFLTITCGFSIAQEKEISGKITSSQDSLGIPGVTVVVVGTNVGTATDINGNYKIITPATAKFLRFTGIGMKTKELEISSISDTMDIVLDPDVMKLDEVVVTALGIPKEKKQLSYAVQNLGGEEISNAGQQNIVNSLGGKIAGATVTSSAGTPGASSYIILRGPTSILGENQPLFVIDGIPFDNTHQGGGNPDNGTNNNLIGSTGAVTYSNRGIDINPEDIESVTVLKGPAATALYGSQASSGAILYTTKKGKYSPGKKISISYSSAYTWDVVNKTPDLQNTWVKGSGNNYASYESGQSGSWGPSVDTTYWDPGQPTLFNQNGQMIGATEAAATPGAIKMTPFDNVDQFFRTGNTWENNLSFAGGNETSTFRVSLGNLSQDGIVPLSDFKRRTVSVSGDSRISSKFTAAATITFVNSGGRRVQQGSNLSGLMLDLLRTPISFDNSNGSDDPENPSAYILADGSGRQRNYRGGGGYDNPYWTINQNPFKDDVNRVYGNVQISYLPSNWLTIFYRVGGDEYTDRRKQIFSINSRSFPGGQIQEDHYFNRTISADLVLQATHKLSTNLNGSLLLGNNMYSNYYQQLYTQGDGLIGTNFYNISYTASQFTREQHFKKRTMAFYADAKLEYKGMLYFDLSARDELSSSLASSTKDYGSFFYPGVSAGFIFTEALGMNDQSVMPYGKVRVAYAEAGKDADPFKSNTYFTSQVAADGWTSGIIFPFNGVPGYTSDDYLGNSELKPEKTKSYEFGVDLKFIKNRVGLDLTYYNAKTEDVLLNLPIAGSTGWPYKYLNAATLENKGVEVILYGSPILTKNFTWEITVNWAKNKNTITDLYPGVENVFLGGFEEPSIRAVKGEAYGTIYGGYFVVDANGREIIDDDPNSPNYGYPIASAQADVIGNTQPDWIGGITNAFTWKRLTLSALLYIREGGDIWNGTKGALTFFGRSKLTEARGTTTVFDGVAGHLDENGNIVTSGSTNTVSVPLDQAWYQGNGGGFGSVSKPFIEDGSFIRLKEVTLTYAFDPKAFKGTFIQGITLSAIGRNLWLKTDYTGVDPETSLVGAFNAQGMDYFNNPGTRSYGLKLNVTF